MFETFSRSWTLVKASASVLRSDKELMLFPVISGACTLAVLATFVLPLSLLGGFSQGFGGLIAVGLLFYFCQYTVIIFFNVALVAAAMIRLDGGDPDLGDGLRAARARLPAILGYAAIAATVGLLLQSLRNREGNVLVRLVGGALGAAWTLATFLVVPVLVSRDIGPIEALKESVRLLKRTWGENAIGNVGMGAVFGAISAAVALIGFGLAVLAAQVWFGLGILIGGVFAIALLLLSVFQAALGGVYSAVLYRYARTGDAPAGFQPAVLEHAFEPRR
ncbi:DUF6159 family protein [Luteimonas abyssi]|uniref:DUF6159 family protein n=1 Tax=Luteimonas abyssi TaxID=1247514 RepID=UPI000737C221|nr:DUF6159 family protein [Luteimonas abyssi]